MSLFKCREWWVATTGTDEEFAPSAFCVADIDNQGGNKLVSGSLSGLLRIYHPRERDYKAEDLLLEQRLDAPIIQLSPGQFIPQQSRLALAVLHPRKLAVYDVVAGGQSGAYHTLTRVWELPLERNSFNMATGRFGAVSQARSAESIAVQSIDGTISVFDSDGLSFSRLLPSFLIPGPFVYSQRCDCFFTANSGMEVQCFRSSGLALAMADAPPGAGSSGAAGGGGGAGAAGAPPSGSKKAVADWSLEVGEHVLDVKLARFTRNLPPNAQDVVVLGVQTLFALKEAGGVRYQRRLEMQPACMAVFPAGEGFDPGTGGADSLLLCSASGALHVLREGALLWSARAERPPISLSVAQLGSLNGLVCALGEDGSVALLYLGTEPPSTAVGGGGERDLDYERMDAEHRLLLRRIREATAGSRPEPTDVLTLRAHVPRSVDAQAERGLGESGRAGGPTVTVRLSVAFTGAGSLSDVSLAVACRSPFVVAQDAIELGSVRGDGRTPLSVPLVFSASAELLPTDATVVVVASYRSAQGQARSARTAFSLPLALVCRAVPPVKSADFKITLETDQPPVQLSALFEDLLALAPAGVDASSKAGSVLSLQYLSGPELTVLTSKNAGRYRIQSASFEALWLVAHELCERLLQGSPGVRLGYSEPLPLQEYFELVDRHFAARCELQSLSAQLEARAQQFRAVQKRLLVRFKDRNPAPLANLDLLLSATHEQLMALGESAQRAKAQLVVASANLSCGTQLISLLVRLRFELDEENAQLLSAHLSPRVDDFAEQGWEERTDAALAHVLRTSLGKAPAGRDSVSSVALPPIVMLTDVSKLKKHITVLCDRLSKGGRFK